MMNWAYCLVSVRVTAQDAFNDATTQRKEERTLVDTARQKWPIILSVIKDQAMNS